MNLDSWPRVGPAAARGAAEEPAARPGTTAAHGPVHGAALRAGQDSRADGPRPVVEPDDLDGDVQRPAQPAGDPRPLPVLVLPVSDRPAVLAQRRPAAPRSGRSPRRCSIRKHQRAGPGPDGADRPQHGRAGVANCRRSKAATTIWQLVSNEPLDADQGRRRSAAEAATRRSTSSPTRRSAAWSPSARRTAAARSPTRRRNGCWAS